MLKRMLKVFTRTGYRDSLTAETKYRIRATGNDIVYVRRGKVTGLTLSEGVTLFNRMVLELLARSDTYATRITNPRGGLDFECDLNTLNGWVWVRLVPTDERLYNAADVDDWTLKFYRDFEIDREW